MVQNVSTNNDYGRSFLLGGQGYLLAKHPDLWWPDISKFGVFKSNCDGPMRSWSLAAAFPRTFAQIGPRVVLCEAVIAKSPARTHVLAGALGLSAPPQCRQETIESAGSAHTFRARRVLYPGGSPDVRIGRIIRYLGIRIDRKEGMPR